MFPRLVSLAQDEFHQQRKRSRAQNLLAAESITRDGWLPLTCLEAKTGATVWKERLAGEYSATPIYANDCIHIFNEEATCTIIQPGRTFHVLAVNSLEPQRLRATPAVDGNAWIVRTADSVYRIENPLTNKK